jgi:hypothetical protein
MLSQSQLPVAHYSPKKGRFALEQINGNKKEKMCGQSCLPHIRSPVAIFRRLRVGETLALR